MVEVLTCSPAITIALNGYNYKHQTYGPRSNGFKTPSGCFPCCPYLRLERKSNSRNSKVYGLNIVSMSEAWYTWFGVTQTRMPMVDTDNPQIISHKVTRVEFELSGEEDDPLVQIGGAEEISSLNSLEQKDSSVQIAVVDQASRGSKGMVTMKKSRLHFLEERNEELFSKRILRLSRSNKVRSALELYRSMEFSGLRPNLHSCNSLLSCLLRNGMLEDALSIFEIMKASGVTTGHTYSLILKAIANARGCDAALDLFEELEGKSIHKDFDVVVYNTLISVSGKMNNWVQAQKIWRNLKENGHMGTPVTYRLLVCIFTRCGQNELALDAYHEMIQHKLKPGDDEMQAVIGACTKEGKWHLALSIFQNMLNSGLKPNLTACNALINSLGKAGEVKLAFEVYGHVKSLGHAPDAYTWNALLGALYRANQHADALRLFESIQKGQKSALNLHLYNTTLMSCQRLGLWDRALQLLWQMETSGLSISTASYNIVIGTCEAARRPKVALQVYEHMVHQKHTPDTFTLLSLIRGCVWGSLWNEVEEILNVAPNESLYNAAIQGMCLRGKINSARKLYMKMRESGLKADGKTWALMLQNLSIDSVKQRNR
ncbi:unnamed protein product [Ilex paraguariensis]|uniref:Pentatricopeptide repeat-containing protein n=1 Tax=Ilex paraguariensis TaxID=185542 RepID=A0ABC8T4H3_9AQUA